MYKILTLFSILKYFKSIKTNSDLKKFLIVGLGNIGSEFLGTRHNIGFDIIDKLVCNFNGNFKDEKYGKLFKTKFSGKNLIFLKPNTFMNLSGKAVLYWVKKEKISISNILVIVDDLNLDFGITRLRKSGTDGGHNGLKDINTKLNTNKYARLRFGIGNNFKDGRQIDFVLQKWNNSENKNLRKLIEHNTLIILHYVKHGIDNTMNKFN